MAKTLTGKTAVITGASSGIGEAIAKKLVEEGTKVVIAARNEEKLETVRSQMKIPENVLVAKTDMTCKDEAKALAEKAVHHFGPIDIYVNCAGIKGSGAITDGAVDDWNQMIDVNVKSVLYGIHSVLPDMQARGNGHIINISSEAGYEVEASKTIYCATKYAVRAIAAGLEKELQNTGVKVTNVSPGMVDTQLSAKTPFDENRAKLAPEDIADGVIYALTQPDHVNVNDILIRPN